MKYYLECLKQLRELALFAGAGGGLLATHHLLGWRCVGYVEMAEYPCKVLEARINDGLLSRAPIFQMHTRDFIQSGIAESYRGLVDIITAGFPCQPFSRAGKRLGELDERNGWPDCITIIRIVRPRYILLENSSTLISEPYFGTILGDLAASGYDCRWDCIPAKAMGADHERDRVWIVAHAQSKRRTGILCNNSKNGKISHRAKQGAALDHAGDSISRLEQSLGEPSIFGIDDGLAARVDRLGAIGNGQVPAVAAAAWRLLKESSA